VCHLRVLNRPVGMLRSRIALVTGAFGLITSCVPRSPTPPSGREPLLFADSASQAAHWRLPDQLRMGPWAHGVGPLAVELDGSGWRYEAVVIERTVVRDKPREQLQPCSLTSWHIAAVRDSLNRLVFGGADFTLPVVRREDCLPDIQSNLIAPAAPYVMLWRPRASGDGVWGTVNITRVPRSAGPCPLAPYPLAPYPPSWRAAPPDLRCELAQFDVQLDAVVEIREHQQPGSSPGTLIRLTAKRQRVPGLRLTVFCSVNSDYPGCPIVR
jgi:hypothetical protein